MWRDIEGYEGLYQVSDEGQVRSCERVVIRRNGAPQKVQEKILKAVPLGDGYPAVALSIDGKLKTYRVHILVARAFLGPAPANEEVRHKDGDRSNPRLDNLIYGTRRENMADAVLHGTVVGVNNGNAKLTSDQVIHIRDAYAWLEQELAKIHGVSINTIRNIKMGRTYKGRVS